MVRANPIAEVAATQPQPGPDPWLSWSYVTGHGDELLAAGEQHVLLTVMSVALAVVVALPAALAVRHRRAAAGSALFTGGVLYTIPSLALMAVLWPVFGLSAWTVIVALACYSFLIVLRNSLTGLDEVPPTARDSAHAIGLSPRQVLWRVELPLAVPAIMVGVRTATVSTVGLVTIGALVGHGGFGSLMYAGYLANYQHAPILTATICCVLLAVMFELALRGLTWMLTPWRRRMA